MLPLTRRQAWPVHLAERIELNYAAAAAGAIPVDARPAHHGVANRIGDQDFCS